MVDGGKRWRIRISEEELEVDHYVSFVRKNSEEGNYFIYLFFPQETFPFIFFIVSPTAGSESLLHLSVGCYGCVHAGEPRVIPSLNTSYLCLPCMGGRGWGLSTHQLPGILFSCRVGYLEEQGGSCGTHQLAPCALQQITLAHAKCSWSCFLALLSREYLEFLTLLLNPHWTTWVYISFWLSSTCISF